MVFCLQEKQQRFDHPSSDRDHGDYLREESHGLYHAPVGDHADHHTNRGPMARHIIMPLKLTGKRVMDYTIHLSEIMLITTG
jgi:hypothetical protein